MTINSEYAKNILVIANTLNQYGVPYTLNTLHDGLQMRFPWNEGDIVCHNGSYGHDRHCVESYCFPWDEGDVSCLTLQDAVIKIVELYIKNMA